MMWHILCLAPSTYLEIGSCISLAGNPSASLSQVLESKACTATPNSSDKLQDFPVNLHRPVLSEWCVRSYCTVSFWEVRERNCTLSGHMQYFFRYFQFMVGWIHRWENQEGRVDSNTVFYQMSQEVSVGWSWVGGGFPTRETSATPGIGFLSAPWASHCSKQWLSEFFPGLVRIFQALSGDC